MTIVAHQAVQEKISVAGYRFVCPISLVFAAYSAFMAMGPKLCHLTLVCQTPIFVGCSEWISVLELLTASAEEESKETQGKLSNCS